MPNSRRRPQGDPQVPRSQPNGLHQRRIPKDIYREPGPRRVCIWGLAVQFLTPLPGDPGANSGCLDFVRTRATNETFARKVKPNCGRWSKGEPQVPRSQPKGGRKGGNGELYPQSPDQPQNGDSLQIQLDSIGF